MCRPKCWAQIESIFPQGNILLNSSAHSTVWTLHSHSTSTGLVSIKSCIKTYRDSFLGRQTDKCFQWPCLLCGLAICTCFVSSMKRFWGLFTSDSNISGLKGKVYTVNKIPRPNWRQTAPVCTFLWHGNSISSTCILIVFNLDWQKLFAKKKEWG